MQQIFAFHQQRFAAQFAEAGHRIDIRGNLVTVSRISAAASTSRRMVPNQQRGAQLAARAILQFVCTLEDAFFDASGHRGLDIVFIHHRE